MILKLFKGKRGEAGQDGEKGTGTSDIRGSVVDSPSFSALYNNKISRVGEVSWSRAGDGLIRDRYGEYKWINGDDFTNFTLYSVDTSQWGDPGGLWSIDSSGNLDPLGGNTADILVADLTTVPFRNVIGLPLGGSTGANTFTISFWAKKISGVVSDIYIDGDGFSFDTGITITSSYIRYSVTIAASGSNSTLYISPQMSSGSKVAIWGVQYENGSIMSDYIPTSGAIDTLPNSINPWRANQYGYLIEDQKTNNIKNSENLSGSNWTITDGIVSAFTGADPLGETNKNIKITFDTSANILLESAGVFTQGVEYSVSFDLMIYGGSVSSVTAALSEGAQTVVGGTLPNGNFERVTLKCTAGLTSGLQVRATSANLSGIIILTNLQVETGEVSSYIKTGDTTITRQEDDVNSSYSNSFPNPTKVWSCSFSVNLIANDPVVKYIFNNGLSGSDEFSASFQGDTLSVIIGDDSVVFTDVLQYSFFGIVHTESDVKLYGDGLLVDTQSISGTSNTESTTMYIGSDETASKSINAYLSMFDFYDTNLTSDEMRYKAGV
ncbi:MAG: hypothetical protein GY928_16370 [Colwellia sp.]|nr:hypothetical protein [Colwellia sp.]